MSSLAKEAKAERQNLEVKQLILLKLRKWRAEPSRREIKKRRISNAGDDHQKLKPCEENLDTSLAGSGNNKGVLDKTEMSTRNGKTTTGLLASPNAVLTNQSIKHVATIDTFSGIGGFSYAAERIVGGYQTVAFVERKPFCQKVLRKHWPEVPIFDDITTYTPEGDQLTFAADSLAKTSTSPAEKPASKKH